MSSTGGVGVKGVIIQGEKFFEKKLTCVKHEQFRAPADQFYCWRRGILGRVEINIL